MTMAVLFGTLIIFLALSVPVGVALGLATMTTLLVTDTISLNFLAQGLITQTDSFPLMAIPFFILAGEIMAKSGISRQLFDLANTMVGRLTGGFAMAAIIASMIFAAISGSAPATVAAIGSVMIPAMVDRGYDKKFATATVAAAGTLGIVIPPSITMVLYGVSASASISDLFIAGIIPGILIGLSLMVWAYIYSKKNGFKGSEEKFTFLNFFKSLWKSKWALLIPVLILGGIYGGIVTPTEAGAIAVVASVIIGMFLHRELSLKDLPGILKDSAITTSTILLIVGVAGTFGRVLNLEKIPEQIANGLLSISENPILILLLINILLLIVGTFLESGSAVIILTPILLPIATTLGVDPVHFGIIMVINLSIGFITPPVGINLFIGSAISRLPVLTIARAILPYLIAMIISLLLITFLPSISMFLVSFSQ
jgi:C4-dicarboxylate transporter DctM subunit